MDETLENIRKVKESINTTCRNIGRSPETVRLIAVSKNFAAARIIPVYESGHRDFGENRVQELLKKMTELPQDIRWHLIGSLQRNKVKDVIGRVFFIHSVDSLTLAVEISRQSVQKAVETNILLQVNISGEESKHGFSPQDLLCNINEILRLPGIRIRGLMTMAPLVADPDKVRTVFCGLAELAGRLENENPGLELPELSMGMSDDYIIAVEEGATMVRIGSCIFGQRKYEEGES